MKTIQKRFIQKSLTYDKQLSSNKWYKLKELIRESGIDIKIDRDNEMFLTIDDRADIELYPLHDYNGEFVHIQLWYYKFRSDRLNQLHLEKHRNYSGIPAAMEYINTIYRDVNMDKKLKGCE